MPAHRSYCIVLFQYELSFKRVVSCLQHAHYCRAATSSQPIIVAWFTTGTRLKDSNTPLCLVASLGLLLHYTNRLFSFFYDDNAMVSVISKSSLLNCNYLVPNIL